MLTPLHDDRLYLCPGEAAPVSRAVHLARLASSYGKCGDCPHRRDVNAWLPPRVSESVEPPPARERNLIRVVHGFRGRSGDPLDRTLAMHWASALASVLWDDRIDAVEIVATDRTAPLVVVGYDERSSSPDLFTGVVRGLERMSCRVRDIGLTTEPCLRFAIQTFHADAGLMVSGSGRDPAWNGLDVFREFGLPPDAAFLDRWQTGADAPISRPSRSPGSVSAASIAEAYEASLAGRFHAMRPLTVIFGTPSRQLKLRLQQLFARLPGRIEVEMLPIRRRELADPQDADVRRIGQAVRERQAHLGVVIGDDGAACVFLDERGELAAASAWQLRIIEHLLSDEAGGKIVLDTHVWDQLAPAVTSAGGRPILVAAADRAARLMFESALAAFGADHRVWFGGELPACDAIVTLAAIWQALSRSDAPASAALA